MSILNLLKEKTADEKQNFLNSIRSKASSKLKNTDDNKIKEEFDETVRIIKKYYKTNFRV